MPDLEKLTTAALLEDLGRLQRYGDRIARTDGPFTYIDRVETLRAELASRGVETPDFAMKPTVPCRLRPLADHVVILPREAETLSEGGIVIPETAKEKPRTGEVLAVGPGRTEPGVGTIVPALSIGDDVLFGLYSGISFELDGQAVLIMREEDVLGILQPKASE